jgi:hypothetical protein
MIAAGFPIMLGRRTRDIRIPRLSSDKTTLQSTLDCSALSAGRLAELRDNQVI